MDTSHYITEYASPVGALTLASDGNSLTGLWLRGQKYFGATLENGAENRSIPVFEQTRQWLDRYFDGENPALSLPLAPPGSDFRKAVWDLLLAIPYGTTTTYGDIAKKLAAKIGRPSMSAQAVGGAVGHNPISIVIPCHRVVGTNGSLTGYAGGIDKKVKLLALEQADLARFFVPATGTAL